jgi:hypothetical protein
VILQGVALVRASEKDAVSYHLNMSYISSY